MLPLVVILPAFFLVFIHRRCERNLVINPKNFSPFLIGRAKIGAFGLATKRLKEEKVNDL
jgi:hypothetical protein